VFFTTASIMVGVYSKYTTLQHVYYTASRFHFSVEKQWTD